VESATRTHPEAKKHADKAKKAEELQLKAFLQTLRRVGCSPVTCARQKKAWREENPPLKPASQISGD